MVKHTNLVLPVASVCMEGNKFHIHFLSKFLYNGVLGFRVLGGVLGGRYSLEVATILDSEILISISVSSCSSDDSCGNCYMQFSTPAVFLIIFHCLLLNASDAHTKLLEG